jgi:transposase InsO family protein
MKRAEDDPKGRVTWPGLFQTEFIRKRGPWRNSDDVEFATLEWVAWFNHRCLLEPLGYVAPTEFENSYYDHKAQEDIDHQ